MSDFETFRYANNFYLFLVLLICANTQSILNDLKLREHIMKFGLGVVTIVFAYSTPLSYDLRSNLHLGEFNTRILPFLMAQKAIEK